MLVWFDLFDLFLSVLCEKSDFDPIPAALEARM
jgi:hypothetical protein